MEVRSRTELINLCMRVREIVYLVINVKSPAASRTEYELGLIYDARARTVQDLVIFIWRLIRHAPLRPAITMFTRIRSRPPSSLPNKYAYARALSLAPWSIHSAQRRVLLHTSPKREKKKRHFSRRCEKSLDDGAVIRTRYFTFSLHVSRRENSYSGDASLPFPYPSIFFHRRPFSRFPSARAGETTSKAVGVLKGRLAPTRRPTRGTFRASLLLHPF